MESEVDINTGREIGAAIRAARKRLGLSQADVCRKIGVSRSTLDHIERFNGRLDVGVLKMIAAARQAGLQMGVHGESPGILERRMERARAAAHVASVREKHFRFAAMLAVNDKRALARLKEAREMVRLWVKNRSCSEEFIARWSDIVNREPASAAKRILSIEPDWLNALFQNTPLVLGSLE